MKTLDGSFPICRLHGKPTKRQSCRECNSAYMRGYLKRRRLITPERSLWDRAQKRAKSQSIVFLLPRNSIFVPTHCPALGIPIEVRKARADCSPSLDRVIPSKGYVPGNVKVISDRANRLKGNRGLGELIGLAESGPIPLRSDYSMIARYLERELLLAEIWAKATMGGRAGEEWVKINFALNRLFQRKSKH